jgi:ergothioneine biosynthesis protein EgtB
MSQTPARDRLVEWYRRNRRRSEALFDLIADDAYFAQPIALRHPIVFYEGHLPAFSFNTLVKNALGESSIDERLERLFARGIDPQETDRSTANGLSAWPDRRTVRAFAHEADQRVLRALTSEDLDRPGHPLLDRAEAAFTILEHEAMHHETLLYMWHQLPFGQKRRPAEYRLATDAPVPAQAWVEVPAGRATLGTDRSTVPFSWDNERAACTADVAVFLMQRHDVTNAEFAEFVDAGGYRDDRWWRPEDWAWIQRQQMSHPAFWTQDDGWWWRGMFELVPLPAAWPVYVTWAEARAYLQWRGWRLPTEAEFQRAAYGDPAGAERHYPWGGDAPDDRHGVFDFTSWDPAPAGSRPEGQSAWGIHDLVGNGWEWTGSVFAPFPGFSPLPSYPEYSADFFDGDHYVMKGASPATARELLRPTFRNWFRPRYPYVYATFRGVRDVS